MALAFKRFLFLVGIALAAGAFLAAGAELAALAINSDLSLLPGAAEVWQTLAPRSYAAAVAHPTVDAILSVLRLPGWLLLGAPGLALIVSCRESDDALSHAGEHSLFLFDELAKRAREEGYDSSTDEPPASALDFEPADDHYAHDDVADDVLPEHDFLLGGTAKPPRRDDDA